MKRNTITKHHKHTLIKFIIYCVLIAFTMIVMYGFSSQDVESSWALSDVIGRFFASLLVPGFNAMDASTQMTIIVDYRLVIRKSMHFLEYALLSALFTATFWYLGELLSRFSSKAFLRKLGMAALAAWITAALFAFIDEFHQLFVDGRTGQLLDVGIDALGALCGVIVAGAILHVSTKRSTKHGRHSA